MLAPVVPITLASTVPMASSAVLVAGVPTSVPRSSTPPPVVYSARSSTMKGRYSCISTKATSAPAFGRPNTSAKGSRNAAPQAAAILP